MKKLVKYTVYFWYEDDYWDKEGNDDGDGDENMRYFIEEHNCHSNFLSDIQRSMSLAEDDICGSGKAEIIKPSEVPEDLYPYEMTKEKDVKTK